MFLGETEPAEQAQVDEAKALAMKTTAELRDQLYDENQGVAVKTIAGVALGMYVVYRFLFSR